LLNWIAIAFLAAMALGLFVGPLSGPGHGLSGLAILWGIAFGYAAAAFVQREYHPLDWWRPSLTQGLGFTWFAGWTVLLALTLVRILLVDGPSQAQDFVGGAAVLFGLFVAGPLVGGWFLARWRARPRYRGLVED
jgi:hypothetical protein